MQKILFILLILAINIVAYMMLRISRIRRSVSDLTPAPAPDTAPKVPRFTFSKKGMLKKTLFILLILVMNIGVYLVMFPQYNPLRKEAVYMAVVGPLDDPRGQAMRQGAELYKDMINREGGIDGRNLELLFYNDNDNPKTAEMIASNIANENKILAVIGHYRNGPSEAAGEIYKRNEIPAITASATAESVTLGNEWYFRVIPTNKTEAGFVANYIYRGMRKQSASIVFTNDDYGITLAEHFERTANSVGMKIKQKWEWNRAKDGNDRAKEIVSQLNATDDPGVLFLATHSAEGIKIITTLKDDWESRPCPILGSYAFARSFFIEIAEEYPREFSDPGYYSNNTLFITPFMTDIGGAEAYQFKQSFLEKYGEQPGEISGCYYNAANVAVEAFKKAGIHGKEHIREDRRRIRDALAGFYSEESGVKSISGVIYFDENGDARTHYAVGVWQRQQTMPAFLQYHKADIGSTDILKKVLDGEILLVNGIGMNDIRLVYAGIDNVRLNRLDIKNSSCSLAFDLWFGYSGYFDDAAIEFENSVQPIQLEKPVEEQKWENITKHRYHVEGDFKCDFDFRAYPFDRQMIPIRFRHRSQTNDRVIYIPDIMSLPKSVSGSADGWEMGRIEFYQDAISKNTTLGNPEYFSSDHALSYSRFNTQIEIRRESAGGFAAIKFLPAIAGFLLLCLIHFIGSGRLHIRVLIFMAVLAGTTFFHLVNASALPVQYLTILNYVFFAVYGLTLFSAFKSVRDYRRQILK